MVLKRLTGGKYDVGNTEGILQARGITQHEGMPHLLQWLCSLGLLGGYSGGGRTESCQG